MKAFTLIGAIAMTLATSGVTTAVAAGKIDLGKHEYDSNCVACHGKDAKKPLTPEYPKLAGQNAKYAEKQMQDIKSGARANGIRAAIAKARGRWGMTVRCKICGREVPLVADQSMTNSLLRTRLQVRARQIGRRASAIGNSNHEGHTCSTCHARADHGRRG